MKAMIVLALGALAISSVAAPEARADICSFSFDMLVTSLGTADEAGIDTAFQLADEAHCSWAAL